MSTSRKTGDIGRAANRDRRPRRVKAFTGIAYAPRGVDKVASRGQVADMGPVPPGKIYRGGQKVWRGPQKMYKTGFYGWGSKSAPQAAEAEHEAAWGGAVDPGYIEYVKSLGVAEAGHPIAPQPKPKQGVFTVPAQHASPLRLDVDGSITVRPNTGAYQTGGWLEDMMAGDPDLPAPPVVPGGGLEQVDEEDTDYNAYIESITKGVADILPGVALVIDAATGKQVGTVPAGTQAGPGQIVIQPQPEKKAAMGGPMVWVAVAGAALLGGFLIFGQKGKSS